ncbi:Polyketide cyclase / dehydrase and lipid transport [compost metagenome]
MISLSTARRIAVPADRVWRMISTDEVRNFVLGKYIESIEVENDGPGGILTVTTKAGAVVKERIDDYDHAEREFSYSIVDSGPRNYAYFRGVLRVQPCGPNESMLSERCRFITESGKEDETREAWLAGSKGKLNLIAEYLEAGAQS